MLLLGEAERLLALTREVGAFQTARLIGVVYTCGTTTGSRSSRRRISRLLLRLELLEGGHLLQIGGSGGAVVHRSRSPLSALLALLLMIWLVALDGVPRLLLYLDRVERLLAGGAIRFLHETAGQVSGMLA